MLTDSEIKELIVTLLDCRKKLLWMINHDPENEEQRKYIENGDGLLQKVNQYLKDFNVKLPD